MAVVPLAPVKFGIIKLKYQGHTISSHTVELEIKGMEELS